MLIYYTCRCGYKSSESPLPLIRTTDRLPYREDCRLPKCVRPLRPKPPGDRAYPERAFPAAQTGLLPTAYRGEDHLILRHAATFLHIEGTEIH